MHIIWNGLLSKAIALQNEYGTKDLRFFGVSIGWFGFGFLVGVNRQPTKRAQDAAHWTCKNCHYANDYVPQACTSCNTPRQ